MKLPLLKQDKANHVLYGAACWLVAAGALVLFGMPPSLAQYLGLLAALGLGIAKELRDHYKSARAIAAGQPPETVADPWDAVATAAGGAGMWLGAAITQGC